MSIWEIAKTHYRICMVVPYSILVPKSPPLNQIILGLVVKFVSHNLEVVDQTPLETL